MIVLIGWLVGIILTLIITEIIFLKNPFKSDCWSEAKTYSFLIAGCITILLWVVPYVSSFIWSFSASEPDGGYGLWFMFAYYGAIIGISLFLFINKKLWDWKHKEETNKNNLPL